jgi:hypothetical protein
MPIPISLEEGHGIRSVLGEWAQHIERAVRDHFPAMGVARIEEEHEIVLFLSEQGAPRGELVLRWDPAAPHELNIFPQPAREAAASRAKAHALAFRVAVACVIAVCALWLGAAVGLWGEFTRMSDTRDKTAIALIGAFAWVSSTAGLALLVYYLVQRSHRAIDAPRLERSRQWLDIELWPWLLAVIEEVSQRARQDPALAQRLAADL